MLIDLDIVDANIAQMAAFARRAGLRLRPHAKTHKSLAMARRQLAAGAAGAVRGDRLRGRRAGRRRSGRQSPAGEGQPAKGSLTSRWPIPSWGNASSAVSPRYAGTSG